MVKVDQDIERHGDVIPAERPAPPEVLQRVVLRVGHLIEPQ